MQSVLQALWVVKSSMITDDVQTMLFEAACFDGTNIRLSSKKRWIKDRRFQ